jgi:Cys-rich protein (TIGR01571 family)
MATASEAGTGAIAQIPKTLKEFWEALDGKASGWQHGLCTDCISDPVMWVQACVCPCVLAGAITSKQGGNGCVSCCCFMFCAPCHLCGFRVPERKAIREKAGAQGDIISDCYFAGSCVCCAMMQQAKAQGSSGFVTFDPPSQETMK